MTPFIVAIVGLLVLCGVAYWFCDKADESDRASYFRGRRDGAMEIKNAAVKLGHGYWEARLDRAVDAPPENVFHWNESPKKDDPAR